MIFSQISSEAILLKIVIKKQRIVAHFWSDFFLILKSSTKISLKMRSSASLLGRIFKMDRPTGSKSY